MGYLAIAHHAPMAPFQAEAAWGRQFAGVFSGVLRALAAAPGNLRLGVAGATFVSGADDPISAPTHNLIDLAFLAFASLASRSRGAGCRSPTSSTRSRWWPRRAASRLLSSR